MTFATNSLPLSDCRISGQPRIENIFINSTATPLASLDRNGLKIQNLVVWS